MSERVVAVVVHHSDRALTERCVASFLESGVGIVLVDNESSDERLLTEVGPGSELICPGRNLGYGAGANLGLQRAFERAPFALVVNNDVTVRAPGFTETLADVLEADPGIGIAGPLVLAPDGQPQPTIERWPSLRLALAFARGAQKTEVPAEQTDVEAVNGVCLMLSRAVFEVTGGFDARYFLYAEELDLSRRAADAGYRTVFVPVPSIVHHHPSGEERPEAAGLIRINFVRFCRDHGSFVSALLAGMLFIASATVRRRDPAALARGIGQVLSGGQSVVDRFLIPGILALWVFMLAIGSSYSQPLRDLGKAGKFGLLAVLIAIETRRIVASPRRYLRELGPGLAHGAAIVFVVFGASSALWSINPHHSLVYAATLGLLFLALLLGPWRIGRQTQGRQDLVRGVLIGWAAMVVGTLVALPVFGHEAIFHATGSPRRLRGFFESPDEIGAYVLLAPLACWWVFGQRTRTRFARAAAASTFLLFLAEVFLSGNRAGAVLLIGSVGLYVVGWRLGSSAALGVLAATVIGSIFAVFWVISPSFSGSALPAVLRPASLSTLGGRTEAWSAATKLTAQRRFSGFGLGGEPEALAYYRADGNRLYDECLGVPAATTAGQCGAFVSRGRRLFDFQGANVHNSYLSVGIELGEVAMLVLVTVLLGWAYRLARAVRRGDGLAAALFAGVVAGLGWAFFSTYLINPGNVVTGIFWLLLTVGLAAPKTAKRAS